MRPRSLVPIAVIALVAGMACIHRKALPAADAPPTPLALPIPAWAMDTLFPPVLPYDNPLTAEGVALGERLFHEPLLSGDGSLSCASCHQRAQAFGDARNFPSAHGHARNGMPLMNLVFQHYFFWDARALTLELQAFEPVTAHAEMNSSWAEVVARLQAHAEYPALFRRAFGSDRVDSLHVAYALAQYERTLLSFGTRFDRYWYGGDSTALTDAERRGLRVFMVNGHCADCHMPPLFTDHRMSNIGLEHPPVDPGLGARTGIPWHAGRFKTPTLRNVAATAPYMHDGRFATIQEVVDFYATGVATDAHTLDPHMEPWARGEVFLNAGQRADLVAFLHTLTDSTFLYGPSR
ncbi:MAG: cytochrome c peroxidase [Flavobacteriales bacterium]|nr:cytochrome c peroxidase [Flavobacteriales bacterium]